MSSSSEQLESGQQNRRICAYFQTPRGCVKENACDFLHPLPEHMPHNGGMQGGMPGGMQGDMQGGMPGGMQGGMPQGAFPQGRHQNKKSV